MTSRDPDKLRKLLTQSRVKKRARALADSWQAHGVATSIVADLRYWQLIDQLKSGRSWPIQYTDNLHAEVLTFTGNSDRITVIGWDISEEPALLVSSEGLLRMTPTIGTIYPDGFILINEEKVSALLVDIDSDKGIHTNVIALTN